MTGTREFHDTVPVQHKPPMDFTPIWYQRRATVAACRSNACASGHKECPTPDACRLPEDSEFGAFDGLVRNVKYFAGAWLVIAVLGAVAWWLA